MGLEERHDSVLRHFNQWVAHLFCYIILAFLGILFVLRNFEQYNLYTRLRRQPVVEAQSIPHGRTSKLPAIAAVFQRLTYFQHHIPGFLSWLSPPSIGRSLLLLSYWVLITFLLTYQAILNDAEYYERIGFRAAWISLPQLPLIHLLSSKTSLLAYLTGSSYERLNWLHRWVSRTLLVTVTIHGAFFTREWILANFFWVELKIMPMVKYGFYAWFLLVCIFLSSMTPIRGAFYELFVLQHVLSAVVFIYLVWKHIPGYTMYFVWISIGVLLFDWVIRMVLLVYRNIHTGGIGYQAHLTANDNDTSILTLENVPLSWKPGQHIRVWIPQLGVLQIHPYTIATLPSAQSKSKSNLTVIIRTASGISKTMNTHAQKANPKKLRIFISGPYGSPPVLQTYDSIILIAASTGASFTLPLLEDILSNRTTSRVKKIQFLLLARKQTHIEFYLERIRSVISRSNAEERRIDLAVEVAITGISKEEVREGGLFDADDEEKLLGSLLLCSSRQNGDHGEVEEEREEGEISTSESVNSYLLSTQPRSSPYKPISRPTPSSTSSSSSSSIQSPEQLENQEQPQTNASPKINHLKGRPNLKQYINSSLRYTEGEAIVVVCGGRSLVAEVGNCVASSRREGGGGGVGFYEELYSL